ncbi:hypothetical protein [Psychromarinibacter sp. S121]|uniref:hypothetical protein n=1 Tax=Psychromarinibacter sp. S121 TaxID=3415127 RepID=UPI003C7BCE8B
MGRADPACAAFPKSIFDVSAKRPSETTDGHPTLETEQLKEISRYPKCSRFIEYVYPLFPKLSARDAMLQPTFAICGVLIYKVMKSFKGYKRLRRFTFYGMENKCSLLLSLCPTSEASQLRRKFL